MSVFKSLIFILFFSSISFTQTTKETWSKETWSWNIDGGFYSLSFNTNEIAFSSSTKKVRMALSKCNKKNGIDFYKKFKSHIEAYSEIRKMPNEYSPIVVSSPSLGNFDVTKGSELGIYLIGFKSEIHQLAARLGLPCR